MKKIACFVFISLFILSCANDKKEKKEKEDIPVSQIDSLLVTDSTWGLISESSTMESLQAAYGKEKLEDRRVCDMECQDSINITVLYPGTNNEATIYWQENAYHQRIARVECYWDSSGWHTDKGIRMNSTLSELLNINGKTINFYGFGWDYGGTITSFNEGTLERSPVFFTLRSADYDDNSMVGDVEINTDMPSVKKYLDKIFVQSIGLGLNRSEH
jgi:hypothetical protein